MNNTGIVKTNSDIEIDGHFKSNFNEKGDIFESNFDS